MTTTRGPTDINRLIAQAQLGDDQDRVALARNLSMRLQNIQSLIQRAQQMLLRARAAAETARIAARVAAEHAAEAAAAAARAEEAARQAIERALSTAAAAQAAAQEAQSLKDSLLKAADVGSKSAQEAIAKAEAAIKEAQAIWTQARAIVDEMSQLSVRLSQDVQRRVLDLKANATLPLHSSAEPASATGNAASLQAVLTNPRIFDAKDYLERYPELREQGVTTVEQARAHWLTTGIAEGRQGSSKFDAIFYLNANPDLAAQLIEKDAKLAENKAALYQAAMVEFISEGIKAGRVGALDPKFAASPELFNAEFYLNAYPDLRAAGIDTPAKAEQHWLRFGITEGRMGSDDFSTRAYINRYPELLSAVDATGKRFEGVANAVALVAAAGSSVLSAATDRRVATLSSDGFDWRAVLARGEPAGYSSSVVVTGGVDVTPQMQASLDYNRARQMKASHDALEAADSRYGAGNYYMTPAGPMPYDTGASSSTRSALTAGPSFTVGGGSSDGTVSASGAAKGPASVTHSQNQYVEALMHYQIVGEPNGYSGRVDFHSLVRPEVFDAQVYLERNPDLAAAGVVTADDARRHWLLYGAYEGRVASATFDAKQELTVSSKYALPRPVDSVANTLDVMIARGREVTTVERDLEFDAAHGLSLDVHRPASGDKLPVVIYLHGGGWVAGSKDDFTASDAAEHLTKAGVAVIAPDYRLCGDKTGTEFPAPLQDLTSVLKWLKANAETYNLDLEHVTIMGASAGGHLALEYTLNGKAYGYDATLPHIENVVAISPATDLTADYLRDGFSDNDHLYAGAFAAIAKNDPARLSAASPIMHVGDGSKVTTRFTLLAGAQDPITSYSQQYAPFLSKMTSAGYDVTSIVAPGGEHADYLFNRTDADYAGGQYWNEMIAALHLPAGPESFNEKTRRDGAAAVARVKAVQPLLTIAKTALAAARESVAFATTKVNREIATLAGSVSTHNGAATAERYLLASIRTLMSDRDVILMSLVGLQSREVAEAVKELLSQPTSDDAGPRVLSEQEMLRLLQRILAGGALSAAEIVAIMRTIDAEIAPLVAGAQQVGNILTEERARLAPFIEQTVTADSTSWARGASSTAPGLHVGLLAKLNDSDVPMFKSYLADSGGAQWRADLAALVNHPAWPPAADTVFAAPNDAAAVLPQRGRTPVTRRTAPR